MVSAGFFRSHGLTKTTFSQHSFFAGNFLPYQATGMNHGEPGEFDSDFYGFIMLRKTDS